MKKIQKIYSVILLCCISTTIMANSVEPKYKWSVSTGWLHIMPQGKYGNTSINTAVDPDYEYDLLKNIGITSKMEGLSNWTENAGLKPKDGDTLGLMINYYVNDNISLQMIGGVPPKIDIKGKGQINAKPIALNPMIDAAIIDILGPDRNLFITDLGSRSKLAEATAWTPAATAQYHFGTTGINKFRPYVGAGIMYATFTGLKIDKGLEEELITAGHRIGHITNIVRDDDPMKDINGNLLDAIVDPIGVRINSPVDPKVKVKATDALGAVFTLGANYDISNRIYITGSLTYVDLSNKSKITVYDQISGRQLVSSSTKINLNPLISYIGIGYKF
ncbi:OmpW/AlkL family protein [Acinetobacter sp. DSM 11652]|uniref:OmpW/AlkL family protein n=1 Tax=Acinetobacter sp. DSM 11652 TaxID=346222 RepID=UPI0008B7075A|nr:OmpW family outer membrane protein [Acinetobacter sp. DSM 11652]SEM06721.1 outer membrane protein [Acinetobacter sp. DSM 11652]